MINFRKSKEQGSASAGSLPHLTLAGRRKPGGRNAAGGCLAAEQILFICICGHGKTIVMWGSVPAISLSALGITSPMEGPGLSQRRGQQHGEGRRSLGFVAFPLSEPTPIHGSAEGCGVLALGFTAKVSLTSTAEWQIQTKLMFSGHIHAVVP